jgi:hypothetical protein
LTDEPIVQHGWKCRRCEDRIFSNHRHDFVACKCGATFVDGGFDYFRAGFDPEVGLGIDITRTLSRKPRRGYRG